ncbi:MAG: aldo/keto reductase [Meiothermus sp.]|uniref:aldo/keto reductase n=1 Tax=Meiothermus sp. TaxID=1955249 RepID=UPI0025CE5EEC|nr:aldo/keto reductase [Meiothermus sp.]MCS7057497.1 aldo/keto reductase [Meiothermus sp.]MCS7195043.1 aldo/keto reductase [Meiothermus sp.]MCX7739581.1 aldo/keto reductase [Meiothermus sp.]MDW8090849.1 aldo/keto reductase [Meiothermus sp.]MDW8482456.1 aldo/keto reductase [Meiothermus sp.]
MPRPDATWTHPKTGLRFTRLGLGTAPLGGLFAPVSEAEAQATLGAAWRAGLRHFDTAPQYGNGVAEQRTGAFLGQKPREAFLLSTKVGRLLRSGPPHPSQLDPRGEPYFKGVPQLAQVYDYSYRGVMVSLEESLARLGLERVDILYIHDPDADNRSVAEVMQGAYRALLELRQKGVVRAIGVGMNHTDWLLEFARAGDFDLLLVAGRYTLLEQGALRELLPLCARKGIGVVVGGVYNSGLLANPTPGATYNYTTAPPELIERALALKRVCERHGVPLKAAALQFPLGHPAVVSVLTGARSAQELEENVAMFQIPIPPVLWRDLKAEGLLRPEVRTPED